MTRNRCNDTGTKRTTHFPGKASVVATAPAWPCNDRNALPGCPVDARPFTIAIHHTEWTGIALHGLRFPSFLDKQAAQVLCFFPHQTAAGANRKDLG